MTKTRMNILTAVLVGNFLASFAFAVDGSTPWNPYCDTNRNPSRTTTPEAVARYNGNPREYPRGPYGPRIVSVDFRPGSLNAANCRPLAVLNQQEANIRAEIVRLDNSIGQYTRRLWPAAQYRTTSPAHRKAYTDLSSLLNNTRTMRNYAAASLRNIQITRNRIAARFSTRRPTRLTWFVRNHLKRTHIPTHVLQRRAAQHLLDNPELIGSNVSLYF